MKQLGETHITITQHFESTTMSRKLNIESLETGVSKILQLLMSDVDNALDGIDVLIFTLLSIPKVADISYKDLQQYILERFSDDELIEHAEKGTSIVMK